MNDTLRDTRSCTHRELRFANPAELRAEVARLAAAERAGALRCSGNWTLGQILGHLATWIEYPYDGYPPELRPPWFIKLILRLRKKSFLRGPLPRGVKIPKIPGGTMGNEPQSLEQGLARFERAWQRLEAGPPPGANPIFGPTPHSEWIQMHLRHAELHLGYALPQEQRSATAG